MLNFEKNYHVFVRPFLKVSLSAVLAGGMILSLAGCGAGDIQLEGKIFEAAGIAGNLNQRAKDPKLKARSALVLPPQSQLPAPGARVVAKDDMNWPDDPDERRKMLASLKETERKKYCSEVGRNKQDPDYDVEKSAQCGSLFSKAFNGSFGRAEEKQ